MPFLKVGPTSTPSYFVQSCMLHSDQRSIQADKDAEQEDREFWFKIKFVAIVAVSVFWGAFLIAVYGLR